MNNYLQTDPWCIIETDFNRNNKLISENVFSLGNDLICQQANFEEYYSGKTKLGCHLTGIYYPENVLYTNWKNTTSETTDKVINAPNWTGIIVRLNDDKLDLATWEVQNFKRILNMREGFLERTFEAISTKGHHIQVSSKRFLSMDETEVGAISYAVKSLNFEGRISFMPIIDGDLNDQLQNINEPFWNVLQTKTQHDVAHLWTQIRRTNFHVCAALTYILYKNNEQLNIIATKIEKEKIAGFSIGTDVKAGDTLSLNKFVAILSSLNHPREKLTEQACILARASKQKGWNKLFEEHSAVFAQKWLHSDKIIDGIETLQARYKIFRTIQSLDNTDEIPNVSE